jgi:hypothetical protein
MKKLFPVVSINIVGLVFNMFCLREVEATFFQVLISFRVIRIAGLNHHSPPDRKRLSLASHHLCRFLDISLTSDDSCHCRSRHCHDGILHRRRTGRQPSCIFHSVYHQFILWCIFLTLHRCSFCLGQVLFDLLQQLNDPTRILDKCRFCRPPLSICPPSRRTCQVVGIGIQFRVEYECLLLGYSRDRFLWIFALRCGLA